MQNNYKPLNGYIEGYYGRLLNWEERDRIIVKLKKNKMNFYFYAPKEDDKHRLNWKTKYDSLWEQKFKQFCLNAKSNNIKIIVGISPGLDFNFVNFNEQILKNKISKDFQILLNKTLQFLNYGATEIGLLFDDLPNNFKNKYGTNISEGLIHAELANKLSFFLKKSIFVVPRIYADQLIFEDKKYLLEYGKNINKKNITFYSGKDVVSNNISKNLLYKLSKIIPTKIVIWDNFYANDYCPRRLFLGPLIGRTNIKNLMINPTGLIETDLLILDIVKATQNSDNQKVAWNLIITKNKIPINFFNISKYFLKPDFGDCPKLSKFNVVSKNIENLDFLLWQWKTPLSREWFPFLLGLKHDLQLFKMELTSERIIKTQTKPMAKYLL